MNFRVKSCGHTSVSLLDLYRTTGLEKRSCGVNARREKSRVPTRKLQLTHSVVLQIYVLSLNRDTNAKTTIGVYSE